MRSDVEFGGHGALLTGSCDFDVLRRIESSKGGELHLSDAIDLLITEVRVYVVVYDGIRHYLGNPAGFIPASVEFGLRNRCMDLLSVQIFGFS